MVPLANEATFENGSILLMGALALSCRSQPALKNKGLPHRPMSLLPAPFPTSTACHDSISNILSIPFLSTWLCIHQIHIIVEQFTIAASPPSQAGHQVTKPNHAHDELPPITACSGVEIMVDSRNNSVELCRFFIRLSDHATWPSPVCLNTYLAVVCSLIVVPLDLCCKYSLDATIR